MKRTFTLRVAFICAACVMAAVWGQTEDYAALVKLLKETSVDARIQRGEEFLSKYQQSPYLANVYSQLVSDYTQKNNMDKVVEIGERARLLKDASVLTSLANAYNEKKDSVKTVETAQAAIEVLTGSKPQNVSDEQWAALKKILPSVNQYLIGTAYYRQAKTKPDEKTALLNKAKESLEAAVQSNPKNDFAYYQLGLTLAEMSQGTVACEALAKAVVLEGPAKPYAQQDLEKIYMHYNRKPKAAAARDLDKLLAKAKADLK